MKILALGAHPDDIEIGVGGTLIKYAKAGADVLAVVIMLPMMDAGRRRESENAAGIMGVRLEILEPDSDQLHFNRQLVGIFDALLERGKPDIIFTHWNHDSHQDHNAVSKSVLAAARANRCSLYMYEQTIPGGIVPDAFQPQLFIDISDEIDTKMASIRAHKSQFEKNGEWWEYGIKGRAQYRGYQMNTKYAEAFEIVKQINRL